MSLLDCLKGQNFSHDYFKSIQYDEKGFVFFIMPFKSPFKDLFEKHLRPLIKREFQMEAEIATDRFTVSGFTEKIWQQICESCIVIADVSGWNANVLYELGLAHALSKKCIIIARGKLKLPSDLGHIDAIKYTYSFFKKDIIGLENKLTSAIRQVLDRGKIKSADFINWRQTRGPWLIRDKELELVAQLITPDAYYIWSPVPFSQYLNIKFRLKFITQNPLDFRVSLFATTPNETYQSSNHLLLISPWEYGGHRIDGLVSGRPSQIVHWANKFPLTHGQQYYYDVTVDSQQILLKIDGTIIFQEAIQTFRQFLIKPAHWGFSSVSGHFIVSELETIVQ